jgi:hypothetical protein
MVCMALLINQCDGVHNPGWERAQHPPKKLYHETDAIQHVQVNQFA